jgi:hypothetical protein
MKNKIRYITGSKTGLGTGKNILPQTITAREQITKI